MNQFLLKLNSREKSAGKCFQARNVKTENGTKNKLKKMTALGRPITIGKNCLIAKT
jgi:hypothetical protein